MLKVQMSLVLLFTLLLSTGCVQSTAEKAVDTIIPPSKPNDPGPLDPYSQEATLLEKELGGIIFVRAVVEEKDKTSFIESSREVRQRLASDPNLKSRLNQKMPAEIWVDSSQPNYNFQRFDADVIQPLINMGAFATADQLIAFLEMLPERSNPEIAQRMKDQKRLSDAEKGLGFFKVSIRVGGYRYSEALAKVRKVESVLRRLSTEEIAQISQIEVTPFETKSELKNGQYSISLKENESENVWFDFIQSVLREHL